MSKIGRKPILLSTAKIEVKGNEVFISGPKAKFSHTLPKEIKVKVENSFLHVIAEDKKKNINATWGLHRALLANKVKGAETGFEQKVKIVGLGYKASLVGKKMTFFLGYSHKVGYDLPDGVDVEIDKSGQKLTFKSSDRFILGNVCSDIRSLKKPEPYKGTGIMLEGEFIIRKAGKTKSA